LGRATGRYSRPAMTLPQVTLVPRVFHFEYILPAWKYEFEREGKVFFFEKKKQKTFVCFGFGFAG
jgi:hypothetical protein